MARNRVEREIQQHSRVEGGYRLIGVTQLFAAWWAYEQGYLQFRDLRAYFALHEMASRRCTMRKGRSPCFTLEELGRLVGTTGKKPLAASVRRLAKAGLSTWNTSRIEFNDSSGLRAMTDKGFTTRLVRIANSKRRVPVPRRTIRWLAKATRPVLVATVLGHLFRCVYARGVYVAAEGSISASWVAGVFNVDPRNVKRAKAQLRALNWVSIKPSGHWHQQRYGGTVTVNLTWVEGEVRKRRQSVSKAPPHHVQTDTDLPPPDSNKELPNGTKNQKPATPGRPGVQKTNSQSPTLRNIQPADLRDAGRLLLLFGQAQERGFVGKSEHDRLVFVGAAVHASTKATRNSGGFFWSLVRDRRWHHVSAADERQAQAMLKRHLFDGPPAKPRDSIKRQDHQLSADVRFASHVMQSLKTYGYRGDPFEAIVQQAPQWNRERWNNALRHWLTPRNTGGDFPCDS